MSIGSVTKTEAFPSPWQSREPDDDAAWLSSHLEARAPMRPILIHAPSCAFQAPGGGENQLLRTARALETLGETVRPFCPWRDRLSQARLIHLFGMSREALALARVARARNVPVVLSPICWYEPRSLSALAQTLPNRACALAIYAARAALHGRGDWRAELLSHCDLVLPNSLAEASQLTRLFNADPARITVIPNGVDPRFAYADPGLFHAQYESRDFVLYVGRVEPRKNLIGLIKALRPSGRPLVVIGDTVPGQERYAQKCRQVGASRVQWLGPWDHADPRLASAYAAARVFALPSWFETPGLAALEAALSGCPVVVTPHGCTREYFQDDANYARPDRPREIARAIDAAWNREGSPRLIDRIQSRFLWTEVARQTAEAYAHVAP